MELHSEDFTACLAKFKKEFSFIETVKTKMFPEMNNVELARTIMEEYPEDIRPSHIGDLIDNQNEQDEAEQQFEGEQPDPEYEVRGYDGNLGCENASEQSIFKMADLSRREEPIQKNANLKDGNHSLQVCHLVGQVFHHHFWSSHLEDMSS